MVTPSTRPWASKAGAPERPPRVPCRPLVRPVSAQTSTGSVRAPNPLTGEFIWTPESNRFAWASLLGRSAGGNDTPYTASPSRAPSLKGLPPTFIAVGQLDLFVEENMDYAGRLVRDGVPVELHVYPGAYHLFNTLPGSEIAEACRESSRAALRRAFARAGRN